MQLFVAGNEPDTNVKFDVVDISKVGDWALLKVLFGIFYISILLAGNPGSKEILRISNRSPPPALREGKISTIFNINFHLLKINIFNPGSRWMKLLVIVMQLLSLTEKLI